LVTEISLYYDARSKKKNIKLVSRDVSEEPTQIILKDEDKINVVE